MDGDLVAIVSIEVAGYLVPAAIDEVLAERTARASTIRVVEIRWGGVSRLCRSCGDEGGNDKRSTCHCGCVGPKHRGEPFPIGGMIGRTV